MSFVFDTNKIDGIFAVVENDSVAALRISQKKGYKVPEEVSIIGFVVIKIFNLSGVSAGVVLIQSSMPSAILCYLVASMYSPKEVFLSARA